MIVLFVHPRVISLPTYFNVQTSLAPCGPALATGPCWRQVSWGTPASRSSLASWSVMTYTNEGTAATCKLFTLSYNVAASAPAGCLLHGIEASYCTQPPPQSSKPTVPRQDRHEESTHPLRPRSLRLRVFIPPRCLHCSVFTSAVVGVPHS